MHLWVSSLLHGIIHVVVHILAHASVVLRESCLHWLEPTLCVYGPVVIIVLISDLGEDVLLLLGDGCMLVLCIERYTCLSQARMVVEITDIQRVVAESIDIVVR